MRQIFVTGLLLAAASPTLNANAITFTTFVTGPNISAQEGQDQTIGFTYAGNKFVGSVYLGGNNNQLYQTDLTGNNVQLFGAPVPGGNGEIVLGGALNQGGFTAGTVFAGTGSDIYEYANTGGVPSLFASGFNGTVRQIMFDPVGSFGGDMLVTTTSGTIYTVTSGGAVNVLADIGADTEGMDIATTAWGAFAGDLLVGSEGTGNLNLITPGGAIIPTGISVPLAETVSFVPLNLGSSGNPVEGFYVANFPVDIQYAGPSQFAGMLGDAIVTSEDSSNARVWDIHYNGTSFSVSLVGNLPNQSEDGIFVTAQRIAETTPEPSTWAMMAGAILLLLAASRRRRVRQ